MLGNTAIGCGPLAPKLGNNSRPAFGSTEEQPSISSEGVQPDEFAKTAGCESCEGAGCPACRNPEKPEKTSPPQAYEGINWSRAGKKFLEGVKSPIDAIAEHPATAFVAGGVVYVINKVANKLNLTKIPKFAIYMTAGIATFNVGKGLYDVATGETAEEKENGFKDIGQGAIYGALAVYPARSVAIADKVPKVTAETPRLNAFWQLLRSIPNDVKQISSGALQFIKGQKKGVDALKTALGPSTGMVTAGTTEALTGTAADSQTLDPPDPIDIGGDKDTNTGGETVFDREDMSILVEKFTGDSTIVPALEQVGNISPVDAAAQAAANDNNYLIEEKREAG